jgi:hypothetical protein
MTTKIEDEIIVTPGIDALKLEKGHRGLWRLSGQYDKPEAAEALQKAQEEARRTEPLRPHERP